MFVRVDPRAFSSCVPYQAILRGNRLLTGMRLTHEQRLCSPPSPRLTPSSAAVVQARVFAFSSTNAPYRTRVPYARHTLLVNGPSFVLIAAPLWLHGTSARRHWIAGRCYGVVHIPLTTAENPYRNSKSRRGETAELATSALRVVASRAEVALTSPFRNNLSSRSSCRTPTNRSRSSTRLRYFRTRLRGCGPGQRER